MMSRNKPISKLYAFMLAAVFALTLAGCGGGGGAADVTPPPPAGPTDAELIAAAQKAAATAAAAAKKSSDAATAAVAAVATSTADVPNLTRADDAADAAMAAYMAAKAASDAAMSPTVTVAAAQAAQATAESKAAEAAQAATAAGGYADLVAAAQKVLDDEEQRQADVAAARTAAMGSQGDAETDATNAEAQADAAEATAPGTAGAIAARAAATAARAAADAAKDAHDAITDDMTKAEADAKAAEAATAAATANTQYMTAKSENDAIQTAHGIGNEQRRKQAIADARSFGGQAVQDAKDAADDAQAAADAAKVASDAASAAYTMAMKARTDATEAKKHADAAKADYEAAQAAADAAMDAYEMAKAAIDGVTDDSTLDEANTARMTAESQEDIAAGHKDTAMDEQDEAEAAQAKAEAAGGMHALGLFKFANAASETDAKKRKAAIAAVALQIDGAADSTGSRNDSRTSGEATATAAWDENTEADADADPPVKEVIRYPSVTIIGLPNTGSVTSETRNVDNSVPADGDFDDDDTQSSGVADIKSNAKKIDGLPGFSIGFDITDGDRHIIAFTDRVQDTAPVTAKTAVTAKTLTNTGVDGNTVTDLGTQSGDKYTGVTFFEGTTTSDKRAAFTETLTCPSGTACSTDISGSGDNQTITVVGYEFTGSRKASPAVAESTGVNSDYLVFGVWLEEDTDTGTTGNQIAFGAFANGGATFSPGSESPTDSNDDNWASLVGDATYNGAATGVYTQGSKVDYFEGSAKLTAKFGSAPTTGEDSALGTITGMISNIMAGGVATGDVINLNTDATPADGNISNAGAISGNARMGAAKVSGDTVTYPYNGTWSGMFHGPNAKSGAKGVNTLPSSVVGTFGVTGTDDMGTAKDATDDVTTSYVGAFGARR